MKKPKAEKRPEIWARLELDSAGSSVASSGPLSQQVVSKVVRWWMVRMACGVLFLFALMYNFYWLHFYCFSTRSASTNTSSSSSTSATMKQWLVTAFFFFSASFSCSASTQCRRTLRLGESVQGKSLLTFLCF